MFKFLFMIFFLFALMMLLMGFSVFRTIKRTLFGSSDDASHKRQQHKSTGRGSRGPSNETIDTNTNTPRKKIFTKEDGDYVDYEEIK